MTGSTPERRPTVRSFLFEEPGDAGQAGSVREAVHGLGLARAKLWTVRHLAPSVAASVDQDVGALGDELIDLDLGDLLVAGWRKHTRLVEAARRTAASPGTQEMPVLTAHRVTSSHRPRVDLYVDGRLVNSFELELDVQFDVVGVAAVVRDGTLVEVRGGECTVTARLELEGALLARRQRTVDLAATLLLDPPVSLLGAAGPRHSAGSPVAATDETGAGVAR